MKKLYLFLFFCSLSIYVFSQVTYNYTGNIQTFTASSSGLYKLELFGASGGNITSHYITQGGSGGYASGELNLVQGQVLYIYVGGKGADRLGNHPYGYCEYIAGGWNGGGANLSRGNGTPGGGASDVRLGGTNLSNRIIVAGGGGGSGWQYSRGGNGGGLTANNGTWFNGNGTGAWGGTQSSGGAAGNAGGSCGKTAGSLGVGGNGSGSSAGGGGGGGYYGGGGGGYNNGGGGGSSYIGGVQNGTTYTGGNNGNGQIVITQLITCASPTATTKDLTIQLPVSGTANITASDINNGSTADCGLAGMSVNPNSFNCSDLGSNLVTLTVTDINGASSMATATVTVLDEIAPVITCPADISVDAVSAIGALVNYNLPTATDNCSATVSMVAGLASGSTFPIGTTTVTHQASDASGNTVECSFDVNVVDNLLPNAICQDATVQLDGTGTGDIFNTTTLTTLFEEGWETDGFIGGGSFLQNWNVIGNIDVVQGVPETYPPLDSYWLDIDGNYSNATITTKNTFDLVAGETYLLSFEHSNNQYNNSLDNQIEVTIGSYSEVFTPPADFLLTEFKQGILYTPPVDETVTIQFKSLGTASSGGSVLDNIVFSQVTGDLIINNGSNATSGIRALSAHHTSFNCTDLGANDVIMVVTANNGQTASCTANVTVSENIPPVITCPANINVFATSAAGAVVDYNLPTATDNCSATVSMVSGLASGETFPIGTTTVTYEASDASGNSVSCSFDVTVSGLAPEIVCPANIFVENDLDHCGAIVDFAAAETVGIPASTISYTIEPSSFFNVGTTSVTATATNVVGTSTNTFEITVTDAQPPTVLTSDQIVYLDIYGQANITVDMINNGSSDNCGIANFELSQTSFDCNSLGNVEVTLTATDLNGITNIGTATVTVLDNIAPYVAGGPDIYFPAPSQALNSVSEAANYNVVYALDIPNAANWDLQSQVPYFMNNAAALANVPVNRMAYYMQLDDKWVWVSMDAFTNDLNTIGIPAGTDQFKQQVSNMNVFSSSNVNVTNGTDIATGNIEMWSNCYSGDPTLPGIGGANTYDYNDNNNHNLNCYGSFQVHNYGAQQTIFGMNSWTNGSIIDLGIGSQVGGSGHSDWTYAHNAHTYSVKKIYILVNGGEASIAQDATIYLDQNGLANLTAEMVQKPDATDNCGITSASVTQTLFDCSNLGANEVTLTLADASNNETSGTAQITVIDNIIPEIACPTNIDVYATSADGAQVNYDLPFVTDNCSATVSFVSGLASGSTFPIGTTIVTYQASDASGNSVDCSFDVTVSGLAPEIVCPANIFVENDLDQCGAMVDFAATETVGIPASTISYSIEPGNFFDVGTTMVTATATNAVGSSTCTFEVTVTDEQAPEIDAPEDIVTTTSIGGTGDCSATVDQFVPYYDDNCPEINHTWAMSGAINDNGNGYFLPTFDFPIGITTITFTAIDGSGNSTSDEMTVTVTDDEAPLIACADDIVQDNDIDQCGSFVIVNAPEASDNCNESPLKNALNFNKLPDYVAIPSNPSLNPNSNISVEFWMNPSRTALWDCPVFKSDPNSWNQGGYGFYFNGNKIHFFINNYTIYVQSPQQIPENEWVHVAGTFNGTTMTLYVNGEEVASRNYNANINPTNYPLGFGGSGSSNYPFFGSLDEVRVWDYVRTSDQISSNMNSEIAPQFGLKAYHKFNIGTANGDNQGLTVSPDYSGNNNSGTLSAFDLVGEVSNLVPSVNSSSVTLVNDYNYTSDATDTYPVGSTTITWTATDVAGNTSSCEQIITINDAQTPEMTCPANIDVYASSAAGAIVEYDLPIATDNCSVASINMVSGLASGSTFPIGTTTVSYEATDASGNSVQCSFDITVSGLAPEIVCPANIFVENDLDQCGAIVDFVATETVGIPASTISYSILPGSYFETGTALVTATATNPVGTSTCTFEVTVLDAQAPNVLAQSLTISLDENGSANISVADVDAGSFDNCMITSISLTQTDFDCSHVGDNTVELTASDAAGNTASAFASISVIDEIAPVVITQDLVVELDVDGLASVTPEEVDNGSYDNCGIFSLSLSQTEFDCSNVGENTVVLTAEDAAGNTGGGIPEGIIGHWDFGGNNPLSDLTGNWGDLILKGTASVSNGLLDIDPNTMARTSSYTGSQIRSKTMISYAILDNLDLRSGSVITLDAISYDNFDGVIYAESQARRWMNGSSYWSRTQNLNPGYAETNAGELVQLAITYEELAGNQVEIKFYRNGEFFGSYVSSNFGVWNTGNAEILFGARHYYGWNNQQVGSLDVKIKEAMIFDRALTIEEIQSLDQATNFAEATITVVDNIPPTMATQDIIIDLDASGNVSITAEDVDFGSSDACGIANLVLSQTDFDCSHVGANMVLLTATDVNGNDASLEATVTILDSVDPAMAAQDIVIQLDASGNASITAEDVDFGSSDACGIVSLVVSQTAFDCSHIGANVVTLTATDMNGNDTSIEATVTVEDNVAPDMVTQNIIIQLDPSGSASITAEDVDFGSSDACGIESLSVSQTDFNCSHVGDNVVTLTAFDVNGNDSTMEAHVLVEDNILPVIISPVDVFVTTDSGLCQASNVDLGEASASDNCTFEVSNDAPEIFPHGETIVTWTVIDSSGNSASSQQMVTVSDDEVPTMVCLGVQQERLPNNGGCSYTEVSGEFTPVDLSDNCSSVFDLTYELSGATVGNGSSLEGVAFELGTTSVTWTLLDESQNQTTCSFDVVIENNLSTTISSPTFAGGFNISCFEGNSGSIDLGVTGGTAPYAYVWSNGATVEDPSELTAGTYTVDITDAYGCSTSASITLTEPTQLWADAGVNLEICYSFSTIIGGATPAFGGVEPYTYQWDPAIGLDDATASNPVAAPLETTYYTLTLTDANGCVDISSMELTVNPLPVASITASTADDFCNGVTLVASSSTTENEYLWSRGDIDQSIFLSSAEDQADIYTVYVTDQNGCTSVDPAEFVYEPENESSSYTIVGFKEVQFGEYNTMATGSLGVTDHNKKAKIKKGAMINSPGTFVKADKIDSHHSAVILSKIYDQATPSLPTMLYNIQGNISGEIEVDDNTTATITEEYIDIEIEDYCDVTITGSVFGKIEIGKGSTVTFTSSSIDMEKLKVEGKKSNTPSIIVFSQDAQIKVKEKVEIGKYTTVNPDHNNVVFYIGEEECENGGGHHGAEGGNGVVSIDNQDNQTRGRGNGHGHGDDDDDDDDGDDDDGNGNGNDDDDDDENCGHHKGELKVKAKGTTFNASAYVPRGKIHVQEHASSSNPAYMTGQFIANEVKSTAKYVIWNSYNCDGTAPASAINPSDSFVDAGEEEEVLAGSDSEFELNFERSYNVYPVPNNGIFTASINSPIDEVYHISIYSSIGELIFEKKNIEVRGLTEEVIDFQNVVTGVYHVVFWNDTHRVVKKVPINRK